MSPVTVTDLLKLSHTPITEPIPKDDYERILASPPFIPIPGVLNMRDLGVSTALIGTIIGSATSGPLPKLKRGILIRSGTPTLLSDETIATLVKTLGKPTLRVFDFRREKERQNMGTLHGKEGIKVVEMSLDGTPKPVDFEALGKEEVGSNGKMYARGVLAYARVFDDVLGVYKTGFKIFFDWIKDLDLVQDEEMGMVHCTAGKDRTGTAAALVLNLIGVPNHIIAEEYALTRIGIETHRTLLFDSLVRGFGADPDEMWKKPGFVELAATRPEQMLACLELLEEKYGGAKGYLMNELGYSEVDVDTIKRNLVDD